MSKEHVPFGVCDEAAVDGRKVERNTVDDDEHREYQNDDVHKPICVLFCKKSHDK